MLMDVFLLWYGIDEFLLEFTNNRNRTASPFSSLIPSLPLV